jgi:hypothetical protein
MPVSLQTDFTAPANRPGRRAVGQTLRAADMPTHTTVVFEALNYNCSSMALAYPPGVQPHLRMGRGVEVTAKGLSCCCCRCCCLVPYHTVADGFCLGCGCERAGVYPELRCSPLTCGSSAALGFAGACGMASAEVWRTTSCRSGLATIAPPLDLAHERGRAPQSLAASCHLTIGMYICLLMFIKQEHYSQRGLCCEGLGSLTFNFGIKDGLASSPLGLYIAFRSYDPSSHNFKVRILPTCRGT